MGNKRTGVRKISSSSIEISFVYQGIRCRPRVRGKPTEANLTKAKRFRESILYAIDQGTFDYASTFPNCKQRHKFELGGSTKFKAFLNRWHNEHKEDNDLADSTESTNDGIVKRLNKDLGKYYLSQITPERIEKFFKNKRTDQGKKITTKTINNYLSILRPALQQAVNSNLLNKNPLDNIVITGSKSKAKEKVDPFSHYEINTILSHCSGPLHNIFKFAFWTGLRPSELIELQWNDIRDGKVFVKRKRTVYSKKAERLKTLASYRSVKLLPDALAALSDQKQYTYERHQHIFYNPNTKEPWSSPKVYREAWIRILSKTDLKYRYPYQTRHTFATMMLGAGENLMWVSNQMGHESTKETLDTYARWIDDNDSDAGMKAAKTYAFEAQK
jgi:integrase|tara:strand:+ start:1043 stop:2203 length:1161 start_codon:yes stop_codon:yes gene_type:complete